MHTELQRHWPVVLTCFATAVFAWGFGFYGQSVFVAELHRLHGWPTATVAAASTTFYLAGAILVTRLHAVFARLGPRTVLGGGVVILGSGAFLLSRVTAPWQLHVAAIVMALGWACTSGTALSITLALWFDRQRGLAISLALNGASAAGFTVAPALVALSGQWGLTRAVTVLALLQLVVLVPWILIVLRPQAGVPLKPEVALDVFDPRPGYASNLGAMRDPHFWSVAFPFALAYTAQVGIVVHLVTFLLPSLGADGTAFAVAMVAAAAMLGRLAMGLVIDRLNQRRASAASFVSQAAALGLMWSMPTEPVALYAACLVFGLSVGNVITLPVLIVQREFSARAFGLVVGLSSAIGQLTFALGPLLMGALRDYAGDYGPVLLACMALQIAGAVTVLRRSRRDTGTPS